MTGGAESRNSRRWCSPIPKESSPTLSASAISSIRFSNRSDALILRLVFGECGCEAVYSNLHLYQNLVMSSINAVHRIVLEVTCRSETQRSATALGTGFLHQGSSDDGNDPVVRLENQVVEVTGGNGSQDRQLISRVVNGEDVQRPSRTVAPRRCG